MPILTSNYATTRIGLCDYSYLLMRLIAFAYANSRIKSLDYSYEKAI